MEIKKVKVMANSIPKGGTNLLLRLITLLGFQEHRFWIGADLIRGRFESWRKVMRGGFSRSTIPIGSEVPIMIGKQWLKKRILRLPQNSVFGAHCFFSKDMASLLNDCGVITLCIIRDPRSIAASHLDYIRRSQAHFFHKPYMQLASDEERLMMSIRGGILGGYQLKSIADRYREFLGWSISGNALLLKFEDLVGENGGGADSAQRRAITAAAEYLDITINTSVLDDVQARIFGKTKTFRKGQIDGWRNELGLRHKQVIAEDLGELLLQLGYEKDLSWVNSEEDSYSLQTD